MAIKPLSITHYTTSSAVGLGNKSLLAALENEVSGLTANNFPGCDLDTYIGCVAEIANTVLPSHLSAFDCRNNRLVYLALQQDEFAQAVDALKERFSPARIGVYLGTSTSGIEETELAFKTVDKDTRLFQKTFDYLKTHNTFSLVDFVQQYFKINGPGHAVSTACSSSAKVFASAYRQMHAGVCDVAIVGGVDTLCLTTLYGFNSLELLSRQKCKPWDIDRNGINIGDGAGFAILEWAQEKDNSISLLGYGESSDAHHMSTPHPQGRGAIQAMTKALDSASLTASQIDYINLHGTATRSNDSAEDLAVSSVFGEQVHCSSTKGWTGHTLGASGIIGVVTTCLGIENDLLPVSINTVEKDPALKANIVLKKTTAPIEHAIINSFGFGGSNCSLLVGRKS